MSITGVKTENAHNVIPEKVDLTVNYRFLPLMQLKTAKKRLERQFSGQSLPNGLKMKIEFEDESPSCYVPEKGAEEFLDPEVKRDIFLGWTDVAQLNQAGITAINWGPGRFELAHTKNERISVTHLRDFYFDLARLV